MDNIYQFIALDTFFGPEIPINIVINLPSGTYEGDGGEGGEGPPDPSPGDGPSDPPPPPSYTDGLFLDATVYLSLDADNYLALT